MAISQGRRITNRLMSAAAGLPDRLTSSLAPTRETSSAPPGFILTFQNRGSAPMLSAVFFAKS